MTTAGFSSVSSHFSETVEVTSLSFLFRSSVWEAALTVTVARALGAAVDRSIRWGGVSIAVSFREEKVYRDLRMMMRLRRRGTRFFFVSSFFGMR